jgi:hypothetical protein
MPPKDRKPEKTADAANNPLWKDDRIAKEGADDRGGSRDGERLEPGDPGDRDQLDNDGGRKPMK